MAKLGVNVYEVFKRPMAASDNKPIFGSALGTALTGVDDTINEPWILYGRYTSTDFLKEATERLISEYGTGNVKVVQVIDLNMILKFV